MMQYCEEYKPSKVKEVNIDGIAMAIQEPTRQQKFREIVEQCKKHKKDGTFNGYNYDKLFKLAEMPEDIQQKYATKTTEAEYKQIAAKTLLQNLQYCGKIISIQEKIKYQQEYLSYIDYIDPDMDVRYIVVTNLNTNYSPKFTAYCLKNGKTCQIKVRKNKKGKNPGVVNSFSDTPFQEGDILYMIKCKQEPKSKMVDGNWTRDYQDLEWWLYEYSVKREN